jgi:NAD kinase
MMASGLSEFEMRNWVGKLSNELSARHTGLTDANGNPMDLAVRLGGDGKDRFGVYIIANEMTKNEKVLSQFDVKRDAAAANPQDKTAENKEPYQIAKDLAESLKNGGSLEQFQKDIAGYIQKMMAAGMSEFDMRTWVGNIGNAMRDALRGAKDSNGKPLDYAIMMSGDGKDGFTVHLIRDVFTKSEEELNRFYVPRK